MDTETTMASEAQNNTSKKQTLVQTGLGKRLRAARELLRINEKEAAARLYLNPKMIYIMEDEDFENGPPATFMRGYIRSYARLLNIPEDEIQAAITQLEDAMPQSPSPTAPPILNTRPRDGHRYLRWMTYVVVSVMVVLVSMWWFSHSSDMASTFKSAVASVSSAPATTDTTNNGTARNSKTEPATAPAKPAVNAPVTNTGSNLESNVQAVKPVSAAPPSVSAVPNTVVPNIKKPTQPAVEDSNDDTNNYNNDNEYNDY